MKTDRRERRDWTIITIIILIGFLCLILAGSMAVRFSPSWQLNSNMDSDIDPNSDYLTSRPRGYIEPVDQSILTPPAWLGLFQTPGVSIPPRTPLPTRTIAAPTSTSAVVPTITVLVTTSSPTSTIYYIPASPTNTRDPGSPNTPTYTPSNSAPVNADLQITISDKTISYSAGTTLTYSVVVSNIGANHVTGATVTDVFPSQISATSWSCSPGPGASCTVNGTGNINDTVSIPGGQSITYTITANVATGAAGNLVNTASVSLPANYIDTNTTNNTATDTNNPGVDLQITKSDGATLYRVGGAPLFYKINVTNNSTFQVNNVRVSDIFPWQISSASWYCIPSAGANCMSNGTGPIDDVVSIPAGLSVDYTVTAHISGAATGDLVNTATVTTPAEYVEIDPSDNSATDTNGYLPNTVEIGPPDGDWLRLQPGQSIIVGVSPAFSTGGSNTPDMVYYERVSNGGFVDLDWVQVELSMDGLTWYTAFYWGDGYSDTNTNVNIGDSTFRDICGEELDNCRIDQVFLYPHPGTGVTIDLDARVPSGSYNWIRVTSPVGGDNDFSDIDSIDYYR